MRYLLISDLFLQTYTLLIYNDDDKVLWKEAIAPRIKRSKSSLQTFIHEKNLDSTGRTVSAVIFGSISVIFQNF